MRQVCPGITIGPERAAVIGILSLYSSGDGVSACELQLKS